MPISSGRRSKLKFAKSEYDKEKEGEASVSSSFFAVFSRLLYLCQEVI